MILIRVIPPSSLQDKFEMGSVIPDTTVSANFRGRSATIGMGQAEMCLSPVAMRLVFNRSVTVIDGGEEFTRVESKRRWVGRRRPRGGERRPLAPGWN